MEINWSNEETYNITFYPEGDKYMEFVPTLMTSNSIFLITPEMELVEISLVR
jgi:hypothetical protein